MTLPPRPPAWLVALVCAVLAVAFAVLAPPVLWEKLAELVAAIAANPDGALTIAGTIGAMAAAFRAAWMRKPPSDPPPPSASSDSDGPPTTPRRRPTLPPDRIERAFFCTGCADAGCLMCSDAAPRRSVFTVARQAWLRWRFPHVPWQFAIFALVALTGCGASALRTHSTIATVARVSVVTAGDAIVRTCETALDRCTDEACIERVTADCHVAGTAADAARAGVRAYVDTIEIAAHADEGAVGPALDTAVQMMARLYDALRAALASVPSLGVSLPELPPFVVALLRSLVAGVTS